jgi:hypothetical protein
MVMHLFSCAWSRLLTEGSGVHPGAMALGSLSPGSQWPRGRSVSWPPGSKLITKQTAARISVRDTTLKARGEVRP